MLLTYLIKCDNYVSHTNLTKSLQQALSKEFIKCILRTVHLKIFLNKHHIIFRAKRYQDSSYKRKIVRLQENCNRWFEYLPWIQQTPYWHQIQCRRPQCCLWTFEKIGLWRWKNCHNYETNTSAIQFGTNNCPKIRRQKCTALRSFKTFRYEKDLYLVQLIEQPIKNPEFLQRIFCFEYFYHIKF